jgi:hypothetical protein
VNDSEYSAGRSVPENSAAGHAVAAVELVPKSVLARRKSAGVLLVVAVAVFFGAMFLAERMGAFWRIPAVALGGAALVTIALSSWGLILGPKMFTVLELLKGGVNFKGLLIAIGMLLTAVGVVVLGVAMMMMVIGGMRQETVVNGNLTCSGKLDSYGKPSGKWTCLYEDQSKALELGYGFSNDMWIENSEGRRANLIGVDLQGFKLETPDLTGAQFKNVNFSKAQMRKAKLQGANLSGCILVETNLAKADLTNADLRGADLRKAYLRKANLSGADLLGADLTNADLTDANPSAAKRFQ